MGLHHCRRTPVLSLTLAAILAVCALAPGQAAAQSIVTEIIDATGDGAGNILDFAGGIAVDVVGNVYVVGQASKNALKIEPDCYSNTVPDATDFAGGTSQDRKSSGMSDDCEETCTIALDAVDHGARTDDGAHDSQVNNTLTGQTNGGQILNTYFIFGLDGAALIKNAALRLRIDLYAGPVLVCLESRPKEMPSGTPQKAGTPI